MYQTPLPDSLSVLGFSDLEQKIYLALLRGGTMSAYQIAKKMIFPVRRSITRWSR